MKTLTIFSLLLVVAVSVMAQPVNHSPVVVFPEKLQQAKLVQRFYELKESRLFWFRSDEAVTLRQRFQQILSDARYLALEPGKYHYRWITENTHFRSPDSLQMQMADKVFTDALIAFCKDIYQGADIAKYLSYDELSAKCESQDNGYILMGLTGINTVNELDWFIRFLQPWDMEYRVMLSALRQQIDSAQTMKVKQLAHSINMMRFIRHFNFNEYVVVNPASATVRYIVCDTVQISMKAVVGTTATPTPRFAGYCDQVVLYPYWNVPHSIAVNEILPVVKRNRHYLSSRNMQVIDARGNIIDPSTINWHALSARNFPYKFRQSTGCDNALGVIKFNLTNPFSVYMHDTNNKTAFLAGARYFSHGCIRLEKPVELANAFLPGKINEEYLEACLRDQKPVTLRLAKPVPVFVVYMPAAPAEGEKIQYFKDVYKLLQ